MLVQDTKLKKFILDSGLASRQEIEAAEAEAEKDGLGGVGEMLVKQGKFSQDDLRRIQAHILGVPFVDLKGQKIDFGILSLIPEPIARRHNIVAFRKTESGLEVAMLDIGDLEAVNFVKKKVGMKILPRLTDQGSIKGILLQYQKSLKAEFGDIIQKEAGQMKMVKEGDEGDMSAGDLKKMAEDLPVVRIVDTLLNHAIIQSASDIHIEPMENQLLVRYRIDGMLHDAMVLPKDTAPGLTARIKVLSNLKLDEKRLPQDGRFKIEMNGEQVSFRVSTLPTHHGEKTVMRLLRENSSGGHTLESLGFHGSGLEAMHDAMKQHVGLILVTGPTGSGKTTTLYTVLDILNQPDVNISTVEDPIEYQMPRINQTQVKPEIGLTFAAGLRSLLRQDPDMIMVGEIRDGETASLAINAALTGHLVLSTLHTNSAAGAIPRFVDMGGEPFLLVSTIRVVIGQRLVRKLVGKEKYTLTNAEIEQIGKHANLDLIMKSLKAENIVPKDSDWKDVTFYKAKPTQDSEDGYKGRIGIHEILPASPAVRELINRSATTEQIEAQARKEGMLTMLEDGIFKAARGETTIEEVFRVVSE
jgi:type IV pilus assembly protein PilB